MGVCWRAAFAFRIESIVTGGGDSTRLFQSVLGREYAVQYSTSLAESGAWATIQSGLPGSNGLIAVTDSRSFERRFYRLRVTQP